MQRHRIRAPRLVSFRAVGFSNLNDGHGPRCNHDGAVLALGTFGKPLFRADLAILITAQMSTNKPALLVGGRFVAKVQAPAYAGPTAGPCRPQQAPGAAEDRFFWLGRCLQVLWATTGASKRHNHDYIRPVTLPPTWRPRRWAAAPPRWASSSRPLVGWQGKARGFE